MKVLLDMNLAPALVEILKQAGVDAVHWTQLGAPAATDAEIFARAVADDRVILTHDLDFGTLLAHVKSAGPSVVQLRTQDISPTKIAPVLLQVLNQFESELLTGALITVDEDKRRVRLLPLG